MTRLSESPLSALEMRHLRTEIESEEKELEQQITKLVNMNIFNFFILSR